MKYLSALALLCLGTTAASADADACRKIRIADLGWTDIRLTDATAELILGALGYQSEEKLLGLGVTYTALQEGDMDVFQGNWRPVQDSQFPEYFENGWVIDLGENLTGAKFTLAVPSYVAAQGITTFEQVAAAREAFGGKIYGIEPGSNTQLVEMLAAERYGFNHDWEVVETSESGMLAQVERAIGRKEPIVFLGWEPHPMNIDYEITYVSGGEQEFGANYGGSTVHTIARPGFREECPNAARLFSQLVYNIEYENRGMRMIMTDGAEPVDAARAMISEMPGLLDGWLAGVTTIDGDDGLAAVKAELGLD